MTLFLSKSEFLCFFLEVTIENSSRQEFWTVLGSQLKILDCIDVTWKFVSKKIRGWFASYCQMTVTTVYILRRDKTCS